jgi:hypothetical protein
MTRTNVSAEQAALHDQLGVKLFTPPPADFNPLTASDRELLVHGFLAGPMPGPSRSWRARWQKMMSRQWTFVQPEFELVPGVMHGPRRPATAGETELTGITASSANWSGAVVYPASGDRVNSVAGEWSVPAEFAEGSFGTKVYGSQWIGIDGDVSPDVLQAGTETDYTIISGNSHSSTTYAWWEWYPADSVKVKNLGVNRGDAMYCLICVNSPTKATIFLGNVTTGAMTSFNIDAPSGTSLVGNCAEWIVESPTVGGTQTTVGPYGIVYFDDAFASTSNRASLDGGNANKLYDMVQSGVVLSSPKELGTGALKVNYEPVRGHPTS